MQTDTVNIHAHVHTTHAQTYTMHMTLLLPRSSFLSLPVTSHQLCSPSLISALLTPFAFISLLISLHHSDNALLPASCHTLTPRGYPPAAAIYRLHWYYLDCLFTLSTNPSLSNHAVKSLWSSPKPLITIEFKALVHCCLCHLIAVSLCSVCGMFGPSKHSPGCLWLIHFVRTDAPFLAMIITQYMMTWNTQGFCIYIH